MPETCIILFQIKLGGKRELISHFNAPELEPVAQEVEEALTKIMREAVAS